MDASKSMDSADFELEFNGTAAALRSAAVQEAILARTTPVALSAFEWSGENYQRVVHGWSLLRSREDIENFAGSLESHERGGIGRKPEPDRLWNSPMLFWKRGQPAPDRLSMYPVTDTTATE